MDFDPLYPSLTQSATRLDQEHTRLRKELDHLKAREAVQSRLLSVFKIVQGKIGQASKSAVSAKCLLTGIAAELLDSDRSTWWCYESEDNRFVRQERFDRREDQPQDDASFNPDDYPDLLSALSKGNPLSIQDVQADLRTRKFAADTLAPAGIVSALVWPVIREGRVQAILTVEHRGTKRPWKTRDFESLKSIADYLLVSQEDITRKKISELSASDYQENYQALIEASPFGIQVSDPTGKIVLSSPAHHRILGIPEGELIGKHIWDFCLDESSRLRTSGDYRRIVEGNPLPRIYHNRNRTPGGTMVDLKIEWVRLWDSEGRLKGILSIIEDVTEQRQKEQALRQAEERFRLAFDQQFQFMALLSPDGRVLEISQAALRTHGLKKEAFIGKHFWEIPAWEGLPKWQAFMKSKIKEAQSRNEPVYFEDQYQVGKGSLRHAEGMIKAIRGADGHIRYILVQAADITRRKKAEEALRTSEDRLIQAQKIARMGDFTWDLETNEIACSKGLYDLMGFEETSQVNLKGVDEHIFHPEDRERIHQWLNGCIQSGSDNLPVNEFRVRHHSGSHFLVRAQGIIERKNSKPVRVFGTVQDVTEHKQLEHRLEVSERTFRTIFDIAPIGIAVVDEKARVLQTNRTLRKMIGYTKGELESMTIFDYTHPDDLDASRDRVEKLVQGHLNTVRGEKRYCCKDGSVIWIEFSVAILESKRESFRYMVTTVSNITEKKQALERLKRAHDDLEEQVLARTRELNAALEQAQSTDRLKSVFIATVSHELRTPLNSIIGFTGMLLQGMTGPLNPEQRKQLGIVQSSSRHLLAIINDVLDISKIEAGQLTIQRSPFDPTDSLTKIVQAMTPQARDKGLKLELQVEGELEIVETDQKRFEQILINLLGNALKFTHQGGITVRASRSGGSLHVQVQDTGIGIRKRDIPKLFNPFQQISTGDRSNQEGTGLGLVISQKLARLLGGDLRVDSTWKKGSIFSLTIETS